jgi:hypothetical protein
MSLLNDPELAKYLTDPKIVRFCEYCRAYFGDPTECFATYNKMEYFYHNLGLVRRTGDSDLRKLRATGLVYSKRFKFSDGKPVVFFYPTDKLVEVCKRYLELRKQGDKQTERVAFRALYGTARRGEGQ